MTSENGFGFQYGSPVEEPGSGEVETPSEEAPRPRDGDVPIEEARAREEIFIARFENAFSRYDKIYSPLHETIFSSGQKEREHIRHNRSSAIVDLMKRHRVFDRELLDSIPLDEAAEFRIYTRRFFGSRDTKVAVCALSLSPLEDFVTKRASSRRLGALDLEKAVERVANRADVFYYVGVLSTTGWDEGARSRIPSAGNLLCCLVEAHEGTAWTIHHHGDWDGVLELYDPETEAEKVSRCRDLILANRDLQLKGGHLSLKHLVETTGMRENIVGEAAREVVERDDELSLQEVDGTRIIKRKRF